MDTNSIRPSAPRIYAHRHVLCFQKRTALLFLSCRRKNPYFSSSLVGLKGAFLCRMKPGKTLRRRKPCRVKAEIFRFMRLTRLTRMESEINSVHFIATAPIMLLKAHGISGRAPNAGSKRKRHRTRLLEQTCKFRYDADLQRISRRLRV